MERYNGWTNHATWCVALWMDNDEAFEGWHKGAVDIIADTDSIDEAIDFLATQIKDAHDEAVENSQLEGALKDLLTSALGSVDWKEIAEHLIDAARE